MHVIPDDRMPARGTICLTIIMHGDIISLASWSIVVQESGRSAPGLTEQQRIQLEQAVAEVIARSGWGEVIIKIERGKVRRFVPAPSLNFTETTESGGRPDCRGCPQRCEIPRAD